MVHVKSHFAADNYLSDASMVLLCYSIINCINVCQDSGRYEPNLMSKSFPTSLLYGNTEKQTYINLVITSSLEIIYNKIKGD